MCDASIDGFVHRFALQTGKPQGSWRAHRDGPIYHIELAADGRIATTSNDCTAAVWTPDGRCLARLRGHTAVVTSCHFTEGGKRLLTSSEDGTARLWLLDAEEVIRLARRQFRPADRRLELGEFAELIGGLLERE